MDLKGRNNLGQLSIRLPNEYQYVSCHPVTHSQSGQCNLRFTCQAYHEMGMFIVTHKPTTTLAEVMFQGIMLGNETDILKLMIIKDNLVGDNIISS